MSAQSQQVETFYLIDASIYIFQSHFSPYVECFDVKGNDLSAVYGFTQFLFQFLRRVRPAHIAIALDESLFCGFRHELCGNYKSNRELPDENLATQLAACAEVCTILGLPVFASRRYEADDIIGTLAATIRRSGSVVGIVSRDKDLAQLLLGDGDFLWDYSANRKRYAADIEKEYGISPEQFPDYLGLAGDAVDCITGVPGVGPVKAKQLLKKFANMEELYQNLALVADLPLRGAKGLAAILEEHHELARLSKTLATIVCDADEEDEAFANARPDSLHMSGVDPESMRRLLQTLGFREHDKTRLMLMTEQLAEASAA